MNIQLTFTISAVFSLIQFFKNSSQTNNEECLDWMNEHVFISNEIHFETSMKFIQINSLLINYLIKFDLKFRNIVAILSNILLLSILFCLFCYL